MKAVADQFAKMAMKSDIAKAVQPMKDKVDQLSEATNRASDRFGRLNQAAKINPNSIMTAANRSRELRDATDAARQKAQALREIIGKYKASGIDKLSREVGNAAIAYENAKKKVADLRFELDQIPDKERNTSERAKELEQALSQALEEAKKFGAIDEFRELETQLREAEAASKGMKSALVGDLQEVGTAAVNAAIEIGNLMKQVGSAVIDASTDVDSAYRDMRKTVNGTEEQYKALYDAAMEYSQTHVTSADTMLEMEALAGQVGVAADELQGFAEVAANLDVATDIDAETIALQMGQISNVMSDLDPKNIQGFGDALVDLGNKMPAQESAIMQISQRLSSVADVAGMSTPEVLGWAAAIASTGQRSEAAATGISNTITSIQSAVSNGGDDLKAFADVVDMSADDFKKAWGEDASGVLRKFIGQIGDLGPDAIKQLEDLGIEGVRQTQTLLGLSKTVENVDKSLEISQGAWDRYASGNPIDGIGEAAREAERKAEGFSGSMAKMKNSAQVLAASLGDYLVPYIDKAAELIRKLTDYLANMDDGTKKAAAAFGILTTGIATVYPIVSTVFGVFVKFFGGVRSLAVTSIGGLVNAFGNASAAISLFAEGGIGALPAIFPKAATAVAAFSGKITALLTTLGTVAGATTMVVGSIAALAIAVGADYAVKQYKANKEAKLFDDAMSGIKGTTEGLHEELLNGSDAIDTYAEKWSSARIDYEDFMKSTQQHAGNMSDTRTEMGNTVGMLEKYRDIIDDAIGKGDSYTGSMGELQWALDGLAEITGETYTAEDILAGKMGDETGKADELREAIRKLIDQKKKQSELDAITNMRTEAVQGQMEAKEAYDAAAESYKNYRDIVMEAHGFTSGKELTNYLDTSNNHDAEYLRGLEQDWSDAKKVYDEWGEKINQLDNEYDAIYDDMAYATTNAYGQREGIIMTTEAMSDAIIANGQWGSSLESIQPKVKKLAQKLQDAKVGATEFSELAKNHPDVFGKMVEQADGNMKKLVSLVKEWNDQQLEDKYGEIKWNEDHTSFETIEGEIYEWTGNDYTLKVKAEVEGEENIDQAKANANEGADMPVDAKVDDSSVDESKANAEEGADMPVNAEVDDSGIDEAKDEAEEGTSMNVNVTLDTSELAANLSGAVNGADTGGINIPVRLDTSTFASQIEELGTDKQINVGVTADTGAIQAVTDTLGKVPTDVRSTITVSSNGLQKATERIADLNEVANKMSSKSRSYKATGNAAGSDKAAKNVASLNTAANNMRNKSVYISANGNVASGAAASNTWNLVHAINSLQSKAVTLTTTRVTRDVKKATGTYINPNKMPKHAAGIFTRPTLTNIGWVGEDGAELYSGNSLVPLTNRKYSMPYIDDISDAVARKLGGNQPQNNITVTVTGVSGPDEVANAIARTLGILNL